MAAGVLHADGEADSPDEGGDDEDESDGPRIEIHIVSSGGADDEDEEGVSFEGAGERGSDGGGGSGDDEGGAGGSDSEGGGHRGSEGKDDDSDDESTRRESAMRRLHALRGGDEEEQSADVSAAALDKIDCDESERIQAALQAGAALAQRFCASWNAFQDMMDAEAQRARVAELPAALREVAHAVEAGDTNLRAIKQQQDSVAGAQQGPEELKSDGMCGEQSSQTSSDGATRERSSQTEAEAETWGHDGVSRFMQWMHQQGK